MNSLVIRAEDKNEWERRTPIVPEHLQGILKGIKTRAYVESSDKRCFGMDEYVAAGACPCQGMDTGDVVFGIKEIPEEKILDRKVYLFFSHTIKGQAANMPMLKRVLEGGSTLIDYERIVDEAGQREVFFGPFAGQAGTIDIFWLLGEYWESHGIRTPFLECRQAREYNSLAEAKECFRRVGQAISREGVSPDIGPLVVGVLGYGQVSQGAQEILDCMPVERVPPEDLIQVDSSTRMDSRRIYVSVFEERHLVRHRQGECFELQDYYRKPKNYVSRFQRYLPYLSLVVNAVYWDSHYPKFVTWDALRRFYGDDPRPRLAGIADISCDVAGAIECTVKTTDSGAPAYRCHPASTTVSGGHRGAGIVILAVDNLPAELPVEASLFFSDSLRRFVPGILQADFNAPLDSAGLPPEVENAVIAYRGQLTDQYAYLGSLL
jgi:alpha-aminoadipic semialdehyde synthase